MGDRDTKVWVDPARQITVSSRLPRLRDRSLNVLKRKMAERNDPETFPSRYMYILLLFRVVPHLGASKMWYTSCLHFFRSVALKYFNMILCSN